MKLGDRNSKKPIKLSSDDLLESMSRLSKVDSEIILKSLSKSGIV